MSLLQYTMCDWDCLTHFWNKCLYEINKFENVSKMKSKSGGTDMTNICDDLT